MMKLKSCGLVKGENASICYISRPFFGYSLLGKYLFHKWEQLVETKWCMLKSIAKNKGILYCDEKTKTLLVG